MVEDRVEGIARNTWVASTGAFPHGGLAYTPTIKFRGLVDGSPPDADPWYIYLDFAVTIGVAYSPPFLITNFGCTHPSRTRQ